MLPPDLALATLINQAANAYQTDPPAFMTYREQTHVSAPSLGRTQDINRSIAVRVSDNVAVMRDLPNGGERVGQAFPIIPYFDPFSTFQFSYFANLKNVTIELDRKDPFVFSIPAADSSVDVTVPYMSFWAPRYAPDSTDDRPHFLIDPTPRIGNNSFYPTAVVEDPATHLPSHIEMQVTGTDEAIALDYQVIDGHWIITHGTFTATQHAVFMTFKVIADVTFDQFAFPTDPPDPRLAPGAATPTPLPSAAPTAPTAAPRAAGAKP